MVPSVGCYTTAMSTTTSKSIHLALINTYALLRERTNPTVRGEAEAAIRQAIKDCTSQRDVTPVTDQEDWDRLQKWMSPEKIRAVQNHPLFVASNLQWIIKKST